MDLITPGIGLIFWSSVVFILLLVLLRKYAWKPILSAVNVREASIKEALQAADLAKKEMQNIKADNEKILLEARKERDVLLSEAKKMKDEIVNQAKEQAKEQTSQMILQAKSTIKAERNKALNSIKNEMLQISLDIASKVIENDLSKDKNQQNYVEKLLKEVDLKA